MAASPEFLLVQLAALFVLAKLGGYLASLARVPPLVGEVLAGVAVANTALFGLLELELGTELIAVFAELGVVFLIFTVGLETDLRELTKVGRTASGTALLGVVVPFAAGAGLFWALGYGTGRSLFIGVAFVATSVGITARVLSETGALQSKVARIILGAAVIDDIIGLTLLSIISAAVATGSVSPTEIGLILVSTAAFFVVAWLIGQGVLRLTFRAHAGDSATWTAYVRRPDFLTALAIALCLGFSALAFEFGLAAIIGAFLAGLLIEQVAQGGDLPVHREAAGLEHQMETLTQLLAPFFFVFIGLSVDVSVLGQTWVLILGVTVLAILSKLVGCGLGALGEGRDTALAVGIGMSPRGEVGIIVALLGLQLGIVGQEVYGVVVLMSVLTTVLAPPLLLWALRRVPVEGPIGPGGAAGQAAGADTTAGTDPGTGR